MAEETDIERLEGSLAYWKQREAYLRKGLELAEARIVEIMGQLALQGVEVDCQIIKLPEGAIYPFDC